MSLSWCEHDGALVVCDFGSCPFCTLENEKNEVAQQLSAAEGRIDDLEQQILDLEAEVDA